MPDYCAIAVVPMAGLSAKQTLEQAASNDCFADETDVRCACTNISFHTHTHQSNPLEDRLFAKRQISTTVQTDDFVRI